MEKKNNVLSICTWIFVGLQIIASIILLIFTDRLKLVPFKYLNLIVAGLVLIATITAVLACFSKIRILSLVFSLVFSCALIAGSYYLKITGDAFRQIVDEDKDKEEKMLFSVLRRTESETATIDNWNGKTVAFFSGASMEAYVNEAKSILSQEFSDVSFISFGSYSSALTALFNNEVDGVLLAESSRPMLLSAFSDLDQTTTIAKSISVLASEINNSQDSEESGKKEEEESSEPEKKVDSAQSFIVYLSGSDTYETANVDPSWGLRYGRSDVNILAVVNPNTKVVLLLNIPRDTYMTFGFNNNLPDKLTHATVWTPGPSRSVEVLEDFLEVDINKYVKIGFSAFKKLVNSVGGIDVYSAMDYTSPNIVDKYGVPYHFIAGINHMDGDMALAFARERYTVGGFEGDMQRNRNQAAIVNAILEKLMRPEILVNYSSILQAISDNVMTDFTMDEIGNLVKMQLSDNARWNIMFYSINGEAGYEICHSYNDIDYLPVIYPNEDELANAKKYIADVLAGLIPNI